MQNPYTYLFPYEKVPFGSKIFIYGASEVGQEYLKQLLLTHYCEVIGFIDRAYDKYPAMGIPIYPPQIVKKLSFDYIVIAVKIGMHVREIKRTLIDFGVDVNAVIYIPTRNDVNMNMGQLLESSNVHGFAYEKAGISLALKYGIGLGDTIVKKKIFLEFVRMFPCCHIDIYCPGASTDIKSIYNDCRNLNKIIDDGGFLYAKNLHKYHLALSLTFTLDIDKIDYERIEIVNSDYVNEIRHLEEALNSYHLTNVTVTNRFIHFHRMKYLGLNYYTYPNFTGVFHITGHHVDIPLDASYEKKFQALGLGKRYITINYGGGVASSRKNNEIAKEWPFEHLEKFVSLFKGKYPGIQVVQLGTADTLRVDGADAYFMGESLELVKYILLHSRLHIDKEGGLVHLATQLGTKCVVCFGPTQEWFFGYPENINIKAGNCHGCYCLYDGFDVCAKGMEKPKCMWGITPEMVMERVEEYLNNRLHFVKDINILSR